MSSFFFSFFVVSAVAPLCSAGSVLIPSHHLLSELSPDLIDKWTRFAAISLPQFFFADRTTVEPKKNIFFLNMRGRSPRYSEICTSHVLLKVHDNYLVNNLWKKWNQLLFFPVN